MQARAVASAAVEGARAEMCELIDRIHSNPELAYAELRAAGWLADALAAHGFEVERPFCGLPSAFRARSGPGPLTVALCAEYDALPEIGHACGHNVIASTAAAAAIGLSAVAHDLGLQVVVIGTPAEELFGLPSIPPYVPGPGKAVELDRGGFDDVHLAMMVHPAPLDVADPASKAFARFAARFVGPAAGPDQRRMDDVVADATAEITSLTDGLPDSVSIAASRLADGNAGAGVDVFVRADVVDDAVEVRRMVVGILQSTASSRCELTIDDHGLYAELRHDADLVELYRANAAALGRRFADGGGDLMRQLGFGTDMGNVSHRVPSIHPLITLDATVANHTVEFAAASVAARASQTLVDGAIALAWTAIDASTAPAMRRRLLAGATATGPTASTDAVGRAQRDVR